MRRVGLGQDVLVAGTQGGQGRALRPQGRRHHVVPRFREVQIHKSRPFQTTRRETLRDASCLHFYPKETWSAAKCSMCDPRCSKFMHLSDGPEDFIPTLCLIVSESITRMLCNSGHKCMKYKCAAAAPPRLYERRLSARRRQKRG